MEFKGTKGKWILIDKTPNTRIIGIDDTVGEIARVFSENKISKNEMDANAKLISCAPLMLEELIKIFNNYDKGTDTYNRLKELIKKATE